MEDNTTKRFFYARCSTKSQNLDRQILLFKQKYKAKDNEIFCEKISGTIKAQDRATFNYLTNVLMRKNDTLIIDSLNRLGRNYKDILESWNLLQKMGVYIIVDEMELLDTRKKEGTDELINNLIINLVTHFLAFAAQKEIEEKKRAQLQGIEAARKAGKNLGRPRFILPKNFDEVYRDWKMQKITATKAMRLLNMSHSTFYRVVKEYEKRKM